MRGGIRLESGVLRVAILALRCAWRPRARRRRPSPSCSSPSEEQMKILTAQSRTFDVKDSTRPCARDRGAARPGFIIERANDSLGLVTAARFRRAELLRLMGLTVTVAQYGGQMLIRANAIYNNEPITDPKVYQTSRDALAIAVPRQELKR